jgi:hypothetical protein
MNDPGFTQWEKLTDLVCRACGVRFDARVSESLAPKCAKCGKDGANLCDECFLKAHPDAKDYGHGLVWSVPCAKRIKKEEA